MFLKTGIISLGIFFMYFSSILGKEDDEGGGGDNESDELEQLCPETNAKNHLYRLGRTRFYIFQKRKGMRLTWEQAKERCQSQGMELAKIDGLPTSVHVGRHLEAFLRPRSWPENYYWINARFSVDAETYIWQDTMEPLRFANFFYNPPRPKGYGNFFKKDGTYPPHRERCQYCLMISLPLALGADWDPAAQHPYGMHTSWWERGCHLVSKANIICEASLECEEEQESSTFTRLETSYYADFWPLARRKFVISWEPRNFKEAEELCKKYDMVLLVPRKEDKCLVGYLKNYMREVTAYSFWTPLKYDYDTRVYEHSDGTPFHLRRLNVSYEYPRFGINNTRGRTRRAADLPSGKLCSSLSWNNEVPPFNKVFCDCEFNSMVLSPENCKNPIGTICQHPHLVKEPCDETFISRPVDVGNYTGPGIIEKFQEFIEFEGPDGKKFMRSVYKQPGYAGHCPKGWKKMNETEPDYGVSWEMYEKSQYKYDYESPYWLRRYNANDPCKLIRYVYKAGQKPERKVTVEDCGDYLGFFICRPRRGPESLASEPFAVKHPTPLA